MKITIELTPSMSEEDLDLQIRHLIEEVRGLLVPYKARGLRVPTISARYTSAVKKESDSVRKKFVSELLQFHVDRLPNANRAKQASALNSIYELGFVDTQSLKDRYNSIVQKYPGCGWTTVLYHINRETTSNNSDMVFDRVELSDTDIIKLKERINANRYGKEDT